MSRQEHYKGHSADSTSVVQRSYVSDLALWLRRIFQVKERFMEWMRASSITTSPKLDILPDSEGEGRCVVCTKDLEKGTLVVS